MNPKHVGSCNNSNTGLIDTGNLYFNCNAIVAVPDAPGNGYGTTARNFFRGPGLTNLDLAVAKTTAITERVNLIPGPSFQRVQPRGIRESGHEH